MRHTNRQRKIDCRARSKRRAKTKPTTRLELNRFGNVVGIPDGWKKTNLSKKQLETLHIPHYRAYLGFERSKYGERRQVTVYIVPVKTKPPSGNRPNKHLSPKDKQRVWEVSLHKLTRCGMPFAHEVAEAKLAYKQSILARLEAKQAICYSAKRATTIEAVKRINPLRKLLNEEHAQAVLEAHKRHTRTDYDQKLAEAHELAENGILDRTQIKTYARTFYKPTTPGETEP